MQPYTITLECEFSEFWRYNLLVQGEVTRQQERCDVIKHVDIVAPVGSELHSMPADYNRGESLVFHTAAGDALRLYIYILPHTLPRTNSVEGVDPFEFRVIINHNGEQLFKRRYEVDQWSGSNIEVCPQ